MLPRLREDDLPPSFLARVNYLITFPLEFTLTLFGLVAIPAGRSQTHVTCFFFIILHAQGFSKSPIPSCVLLFSVFGKRMTTVLPFQSR